MKSSSSSLVIRIPFDGGLGAASARVAVLLVGLAALGYQGWVLHPYRGGDARDGGHGRVLRAGGSGSACMVARIVPKRGNQSRRARRPGAGRRGSTPLTCSW